jgi:hypothetical protein
MVISLRPLGSNALFLTWPTSIDMLRYGGIWHDMSISLEQNSSTPMAIDELSHCYRVLNAYISIEILRTGALDPAAVRSTPAGGCNAQAAGKIRR